MHLFSFILMFHAGISGACQCQYKWHTETGQHVVGLTIYSISIHSCQYCASVLAPWVVDRTLQISHNARIDVVMQAWPLWNCFSLFSSARLYRHRAAAGRHLQSALLPNADWHKVPAADRPYDSRQWGTSSRHVSFLVLHMPYLGMWKLTTSISWVSWVWA